MNVIDEQTSQGYHPRQLLRNRIVTYPPLAGALGSPQAVDKQAGARQSYACNVVQSSHSVDEDHTTVFSSIRPSRVQQGSGIRPVHADTTSALCEPSQKLCRHVQQQRTMARAQQYANTQRLSASSAHTHIEQAPSSMTATNGEHDITRAIENFPRNVLLASSANDGIGMSTMLAFVAQYVAQQGYTVALVDADLAHGGLDVLLGLEADEGRRLQDIDAPLGRVDGYVLRHEMIHWNGVDVLAYAPWRRIVQPWVLEAAICALAQSCDVVMVDMGAGEGTYQTFAKIPSLVAAPMLFAAEMTVLGLARYKYHHHCVSQQYQQFGGNLVQLVTGIAPRGLRGRNSVVSAQEAGEYLALPPLSVVSYYDRLSKAMLAGYGIQRIPQSLTSTLQTISRWLFGDTPNAYETRKHARR